MAKKLMKIGMHSRFDKTGRGNKIYSVHWGTTGKAYNRNYKNFRNRSTAIKFKDMLIRKYKPRYKTRYTYVPGM